MWELDYKESWVPKNWCFWTVVLENTLESPLDCKKIQPVHPKGDQSWVFIGGTDIQAETPILWPPDAKSWPWCWERLRAGGEGDERGWDGWMASLTQWTWVGWTPGFGDGHVGLAWWSSWGRKESDMTEWLNWTWPFLTKLNVLIPLFALVFLQRIWTLTSTQNLHTDIYSSSIHNYKNLVTTKLFFVRWMDK